MIRRALQAAVITAVTIASVTTMTTAAQADAIDCPSDALGCLYDGDLGAGDRYVIRRCGNYDLPSGWWDKANSFYITDRALLRGWSYGRNPGDSSLPTLNTLRGYDFDNFDWQNATDWIEVRCAV